MLFCEHLKTINPEVLKDAIDNYIFPDDPKQRPEKNPCTRCCRRYGFNFFCLQCKKRVCENHVRKHCSKDDDHKNLNFVLHYHTGDLFCLRCSKEIFPESYCKYRAIKYQKFYNENNYEDPTIKFSVENLQKTSASNGLVGLASLGNTCYMNCLLQFFLHNRTIISWLIFHKCNYSGDIPACLLCEIQKLLKKMYDPSRTHIPAPSDIFTVMLNKRPEFLSTAHLQHDVQEVFSWLIQDISSQDDRHSQNFAKLFYGGVQSVLKCNNCNKKQIHYETCFNFFLPYPGENLSMLDCIAEFLEDVSSSVICKDCNGKCSKISASKFISLPQILVLAISPFNTSKKRIVKTASKIALEKELDILTFVTFDDDEATAIANASNVVGIEGGEINSSLKSLKRRLTTDDDEYFVAAKIAKEKLAISKKQFFISPPDMVVDSTRATTSTPDSDGGDSGLGTENYSPPLEQQPQQPEMIPSTTTTIQQHRQMLNKQRIKTTKYKLEGIIYHRGDAKGGHYYAKIKNHMSSSTSNSGRDTVDGSNNNDDWIECNDTKVTVTSIDSECDDQPYLFFYCLNKDYRNDE